MNPTPSLTTTDRTILQALSSGEKAAGELLDLTGFKAYPALNDVLNNLNKAGLISTHYAEFRTFRLTELGKQAIGLTEPEQSRPFWQKN